MSRRTVSLTDSAGHASSYAVDSSWRITQKSEWTGSLYLVTTETWDTSNNLRSETDPRGNETDFAYDQAGNTVAVGKPAIATAQGTLRPTQLYTYDAYNNVIAYCDPIATNSLGLNWSTSTPSPGECPSTTVAERYQYSYPSYEPYGELTTATTVGTSYAPSGYATTFTYSAAQQAGTDFGLPTGVTGSSISQLDGTARQPQQVFWYDGFGNLACYGKGNGLWVLTYDSLNRQTAVADPDDAATGAGICGKSGTSGWNTTTTTAYNLDGSKSQTQTPSLRVAGHATTFTYDADGNELSEAHYFGCATPSCTPGTTTKWYDGADRLIEVEQPAAVTEYTRYKYDLSSQGSFALQNGSTSFRAYGGLYASQVWVGTWYDAKGFAFDALDRTVTKFLYAPTSNDATDVPTNTTQLAYDTDSAHLGLLATSTDALGTVTSDTYDADGNLSATSFSDGITPARSYTYDAAGRVTSTTSSNGTVSSVYDAAGRQASSTQSSSAASLTISYQYYPDGLRSALSTAGALNASNLFTYAYRTDGKRSYEHFADGSSAATFGWSYTNAGRLTSFVDPASTSSKSYDTSGRLATEGMPSGTYSAFTYDPEDEVISYTGAPTNNNTGTTPTSNIYYDGMGQLDEQSTTSEVGYSQPVQSATQPRLGCSDASAGAVCDRRTGTTVHINSSLGNTGHIVGGSPTNFSFTFDAAGRQTGKALSWTSPASQKCYVYSGTTQQTVSCSLSGTHQGLRQYDAENHLIAESPHSYPLEAAEIISGCGLANPFTGDPTSPENSGPLAVTPGYSYWPSGKVESANFAATNALFWDGDKPLVANNSTGGGNFVYLDDFATFTSSKTSVPSTAYLTMIDRDFSGTAVAEHNATGSSNWDPLGFYRGGGTLCSINLPSWSQASSGFSSVTPGIVMPRRDGISDLYNTIQGTRSYDSDSGQWTAPDAYAGEVDDPATQRPYMWNRNNPYVYEDPSGYIWTYIDPALDGAIATLMQSKTFSQSFKAAAESKTTFKMSLVSKNDKEVTATVVKGAIGTGLSIVQPSGESTISSDVIKIGANDRNTVLRSTAGEVYNAGRVATEPAQVINDSKKLDPSLDNVNEVKSKAGSDQIMHQIKQ